MSMKGKKSKNKKVLMDVSAEHIEGIRSVYDASVELIKENKFSEAVDQLKVGMKELKNVDVCFFDDMFQLFIWMDELKRPNVHGYVLDRVNLYYLYGYVMAELEDWEQAERNYGYALKINPCSVETRFELIQILINRRDFVGVSKALKDVYRYIYKHEDFARLYRDYGYMYIEQEKWEAAIAVYFLSSIYADEDGAEKAESELQYIQEASGMEIVEPDTEDMEALAEEYGFPLQPNDSERI